MAKVDVYGREIEIGEPFSADGAVMMIGRGDINQLLLGEQTTDLAGMLVQTLNIRYGINITRLWEIGGNKQYLIAGRTRGQIDVSRVVGPKPVTEAFYDEFFDVCDFQDNILSFGTVLACGKQEGSLFSQSFENNVSLVNCEGCVIQQINYQVQNPEQMVVNEGVSMMFVKMTRESQ